MFHLSAPLFEPRALRAASWLARCSASARAAPPQKHRAARGPTRAELRFELRSAQEQRTTRWFRGQLAAAYLAPPLATRVTTLLTGLIGCSAWALIDVAFFARDTQPANARAR